MRFSAPIPPEILDLINSFPPIPASVRVHPARFALSGGSSCPLERQKAVMAR
jgi:hypothetical protein